MHLPVMEKSPSSERRTCTDQREQVVMPASIIQGVCAALRLVPVSGVPVSWEAGFNSDPFFGGFNVRYC